MAYKVDILGVVIDNIDKKALHDMVRTNLKLKKKTVIFTPNPEIALLASNDDNLKNVLSQADICIADGTGLIMASHLIGAPLPERLAGIELGEFVLEYASKNHLSVFLLGGEIGVAEEAKKQLEAKYKGLHICGTHHGFFDVNGEENNEMIRQINAATPDIIFVCMGFPRQEKWICENKAKIPSLLLSIGLGGSLDVWSGKIQRAPALLRSLSLEWLWRMIKEPKRIKILYEIPLFFGKVMAQKMSTSQKNG